MLSTINLSLRREVSLFLSPLLQGTGEYHYDFTGGQIANVLVYLKAPTHSGHTLLDGGKVQLDSKIGRVRVRV